MSRNKTIKLIAGAIGASAIAFFGYKLYETYKQIKKDEEESKQLEKLTPSDIREYNDEPKDGMGDEPGPYGVSYLEEVEDKIPDENEQYIEEYLDEEGETLRFPPNSPEAWDQFKNMKLMDLTIYNTEEDRLAYEQLQHYFTLSWIPTNEKDSIIVDHIIEERELFFGSVSKYVREQPPMVAELILHFAKAAAYDMDRPPNLFIEEFLDNINKAPILEPAMLHALAQHDLTYTDDSGQQAFGLFGLFPADVEAEDGFQQQYNTYITNIIEADYEE